MILRVGFSILFAQLALVLGAWFGFVVGLTFGFWWWALYLLGAVVGAVIPKGDFKSQVSDFKVWVFRIIPVLFSHAIILFVASVAASSIIDVGWDSVETHQEGVLLIREGWNPVNPQPGWIQAQPEDGFVRLAPSLNPSWFTYCGMYANAALLADLPGGFEGAKGYRFVLVVGFLVLSVMMLRNAGLSPGVAFTVGFLLIANPVVLYQIWTLYMDFDVAVFATLLLLGIFSLSYRWSWQVLLATFAALVLLCFAKRSGPAFGAVLGGVLVLTVIVKNPSWLRFVFAERKGWIAGSIILLLAIVGVWLGIERYGDRLSRGKEFVETAVLKPNEFDQAMDIRVPQSVTGLSRPEQFLRSFFEETAMDRGQSLKLPLSWNPSEWSTFRTVIFPGYESGGFGPLFSGVFFLCVLARILSGSHRGVPGRFLRWVLYAAILLICFLVPSWWARWVPFVYAVPFLLMSETLLAWAKFGKSGERYFLQVGRSYLLPVLVVGIAGFFAIGNAVGIVRISHSASQEATQRIQELLGEWETMDTPLLIDIDRSLMVKRWLFDRGIEYVLIDSDTLPTQPVPYTYSRYRIDP